MRHSFLGVVISCISLVLALLFAEGAYRLYLSRKYQLPVLYSSEERIYPALYTIKKQYNPSNTNVLLMGASVIAWVYDTGLFQKLLPSKYRVYSVALPAHSSLDSLYQYRYLTEHGYTFNTVVYYDAINETRFNNIPPHLFSEDYNHILYYQIANAVFNSSNIFEKVFMESALGFSGYLSYLNVSKKADSFFIDEHLLDELHVKPEWIGYGKDIKTERTYRRNLEGIINLAKQTGASLIMPKFAYNIPPDYSTERFRDGLLGYQRIPGQSDRVELWGLPQNVIKGIDVHNRDIEELKSNFHYIDTTSLSADISNFSDICHFSEKGKIAFAKMVTDAILKN